MKQVESSSRTRLALPRWLVLLSAVIIWPLLVILFHGLLPWIISGVASRVGWMEQKPGYWNWVGLGFVALAAIGFLWFWFVHTRKVATQRTVDIKPTPDYLLTGGPYRYTRNPAYVAAVVTWFGWTIFYGSWIVLTGTFLLWLILKCIVIPLEERGLEARHKEAYRQYLRSVPRWF